MLSSSCRFTSIKDTIVKEKIYKNAFNEMYEVADKETGTLYAARVIFKDIDGFPINKMKEFSNEIKIISQLDHPSLIKYYGCSPIDFNGQSNPVFITELAKNVILKRLSDNPSTKYITIYGIASGMSYLHSHNIIHCNLSLFNILLDNLSHPKITGFKYSKAISDDSTTTFSNRFCRLKGSPEYFAPEIFREKKFSKASDVYSFGVILYEILTKKRAFSDCPTYLYIDVMQKVTVQKEKPDINHIPTYYQEIIKKCWSEDPAERPTFDEIISFLRVDPNLASDEEFQNYVKFIDDSKKSFNSENEIINQIDELLRPQKTKEKQENNVDLNNLVSVTNAFDTFFGSICHYSDTKTDENYSVEVINDEIDNFSENDFVNFSQKIAVISQLNHPSIEKFIEYSPVNLDGEPKPMIFNEMMFGRLDFIYKNSGKDINQWDDTQKLINIYGIACGMSYLHAHNIIHRDLKLENIYLDDLFFPKISGFNLAKELPPDSDKEIFPQIQGTPAYLSPEIYSNNEYSKSSDVYAFSFVIYEILTNEKPFQNFSNVHQVLNEVVNKKKRPKFNVQIPECYQKLIEKCWSSEPKERPTFDEIVHILKTDKSFITNTVNEEDYHKYIEMIDKSNISFNSCKKIIIDDKKFRSLQSKEGIQKIISGVLGIYDTEMINISLDLKYIDLNNFEKKEKIGSGAFSKVFRIVDKKTGHNYAAKIFISELNEMNKNKLLNLSREVNAISKINHPSVVKFIGYSPVDFKNRTRPVIVTEISSNRSLNGICELIRNNQDVTEWTDTKKLITIYGIASAMSFLHSIDIIHRDLKPDNILFDDYLFPKIIDFGLSKSIHDNFFKDSGVVGTILYIAPEILNSQTYDKPGDVYSFSLIMYQIVTGVQPFATFNSPFLIIREVCMKKIRPEFYGSTPQCYQNLIEKCWSHEAKDRPTFEEIANILRTDPNFITEDVNEDEYKDYINYIDEVLNGIRNNTLNKLNESLLLSKFNSFEKIDILSYLNEMKNAKELNVNLNPIHLYIYEKQKSIGKGSFGTVYKVIDKQTNEIYAAKISKTYLNQCTEDDVKNLEREITIISRLHHPSILKFIGYKNTNFKGKPKPIIITELVTNGSLDKILELERMCCGNPEWNDTKRLINIYGIASAMAYLHSQDILHRDLKPANILLDDYLFPKISDFGLSKDIFENIANDQLQSGFKGTYAYSAPEIFKGKYTKAGDVYAFAIIVYEIMTNDVPYVDANPYQLLIQVPNGMRPKFQVEIPKCYQDLIENCWNNDLEKRPTFDEIIDLLKTEQDFITDNVDIDEFLDYVDFVDESNNLDIKSAIEFFKTSDIKFVDLNSFKLCELINYQDAFKEFKLINVKTKEVCLGKFFRESIDILPEDKKIELKREVIITSQINHPLFARFIGYSPMDFDHEAYPVIVYEYASNGTLQSILENEIKNIENPKWNDTTKLICLYGIAFGMNYLHSNEIIHRNLIPSSVFLDDEFHPKISEFTFAKKISENLNDENKGFIGSYSYSAPEVLKCQYSKAGDVYSFAMIAYEILTKKKLYDELPQYKIIQNVLKSVRPEIPDDIPSIYKELIEDCWSRDQTKRPTFAQIVDRLKSTPEFITEKVDKTEFFNYIEKVEKLQQKIKKDESLKVHNNAEEQTKSLNSKFKKVSVSFESIKDEQIDDDKSQNLEFLDLKRFKLGDLIRKADYSKTYKVMSNETETIYSAKISTIKMNDLSRDELINLSREVNLISQLNHPSFLKFIGYSPVDFKNKRYPVIVTELASNGTLKQILESERQKIEIKRWDDTTKLINIYGIASGMSYLHSNNIIHRDLNPSNIFLDDYLFPKIGDFGLSTRSQNNSEMTFQSTAGMKGNPTYSSPEILQFNDYSKSGDVYSFGFVVFEILTGRIPFDGIHNKNEIFNEVVIKCNRPEINNEIPDCYRDLIQSCWAQKSQERPSFDEIVLALKSDSRFITSNVRKNDFTNYVEFIDESRKSFDSNKKILNIDSFIREKSKIIEDTNNNQKVIENENEDDSNINQKVIENDDDSNINQKVIENENDDDNN